MHERAFDLTGSHGRIDGVAEVAGGPCAHHPDAPGCVVDFDLDHQRPEAEDADLFERQSERGRALGVESLLVEDPRIGADDRPARRPVRSTRNRREADRALPHPLHGDVAARKQFEVVDAAFEHLAGVFLQLLFDLGSGLGHGTAGDVGDATRRRSPVVGRTIGVRTGDRDALERHLERLGADLRQHGVRTLPDVDGAGVEQHRAVLEHAHDRPGRQQAADVRGQRDTEAAAASGLRGAARVRGTCRGDARFALDDVQAFGQTVRAHLLAAEPRVARAHHVLAPECQRIHSQLSGDGVELLFGGERDLRNSEATHGSEAHLVGVGHLTVSVHVGDAVGAAIHEQRVAEHSGAVVAVRAAVEQQLGLARHQGAVVANPGLHPDPERMARAHRLEIFLPAQDELHRPSRLHRKQHHQRLDVRFHLVAEAGADTRRQTTQLRHRQAKRFAHARLDPEYRLVGRP